MAMNTAGVSLCDFHSLPPTNMQIVAISIPASISDSILQHPYLYVNFHSKTLPRQITKFGKNMNTIYKTHPNTKRQPWQTPSI